MQYLQWSFISSILLCVYTAHCVIAEIYHIVTSPSSPCPGEFIGEPCLTLQQYAASPSQDSNVTLVIESGTHRLQSENVAVLTTRVDYFTMMSASGQGHKDVHIVFYTPRPIYYYYCFSDVQEIHISGIHFSCTTGSNCEIRTWDVQQLFIKDCSFQGVELDLGYNNIITNVVIFQTCFYDGSRLSASSSTVRVNITRSTFSNNTRAVHFSSYNALTISESTFINNTSAYGGAAIYISSYRIRSILINKSIFVNNTATTREGGALYLAGDSNTATIYITGCTSIYNSANSSNCGAISAQDINVNVTDSDFYYNRANGDSGVACIRSANMIDVSKSTFVQNVAVGNGGAFLLDESNMYINSSLFKNNKAGQDGGVLQLATYVYPSTYAIIQSTFIDNHAEDDGGAVFIGCAGSVLRVGMSTFNSNHAIDRGWSYCHIWKQGSYDSNQCVQQHG